MEYYQQLKERQEEVRSLRHDVTKSILAMQAVAEAAKVADPTWRAGKPIPAGALDGITRESAESLGRGGQTLSNQGCGRDRPQ